MYIDFLLDVFRSCPDDDAVVWQDKAYSYKWLTGRIDYWTKILAELGIRPGQVVFIEADFSPNSIALFLALTELRAIIAPVTKATADKRIEFMDIALGQWLIQIGEDDSYKIEEKAIDSNHEYYNRLREAKSPGLIVFSSGSTGKNKGAVHNLSLIMNKFKVRKRSLRAISFLLYDHLGGVNTMFYMLSNGGCLVTVSDRHPDAVLAAVEKYKVELLPTSPTFLNLMLINEGYKRYNLSSLRTITYGTEPMPESTLKRVHALFPEIKLQQTYGLSETGVLRSKSKSSDSLWVKIGGEGFQTRVVEGLLEIKSESAMLGYLNAPSPFTDDGWFKTMDAVEQDGEYFRILGRKSEIINVGGEKVYPAEVENLIMELDGIAEATVYPEPNPIMGQIVCARITAIDTGADTKELKRAIKKHCSAKLQKFKVPVKIKFITENQYSVRFKKTRNM